jgi:hypothetical protein
VNQWEQGKYFYSLAMENFAEQFGHEFVNVGLVAGDSVYFTQQA